MNMVSLLTLVLVMKFGITPTNQSVEYGWIGGIVVVLVCIVVLGWAVWNSKRETPEMKAVEEQLAKASAGISE